MTARQNSDGAAGGGNMGLRGGMKWERMRSVYGKDCAMKKCFLMAVLLAAAVATGCGKEEKRTVAPTYRPQDPVILIDGSHITLAEFQQELKRQLGTPNPTMTAEEKQQYIGNKMQATVDNLIMRQLFTKEMERSGILITQDEVEEAKKKLEQGLNGKTLTMLIAEVNLPMEALEENLKLDIFKNKVLSNRYDEAYALVTPEKIEEAYKEHEDFFRIPERREAALILAAVPADAGEEAKEAARKKIEDVQAALKAGADFEALAMDASDDASRDHRGRVGMVGRPSVEPALADALFALEEGQVSDAVESKGGYVIWKALGPVEPAKVQELTDEVRSEIRLLMMRDMQRRVVAQYIAELRDKATIQLVGPLAPNPDAAKPAADAEPEAAPAEGAQEPAPEAAAE